MSLHSRIPGMTRNRTWASEGQDSSAHLEKTSSSSSSVLAIFTTPELSKYPEGWEESVSKKRRNSRQRRWRAVVIPLLLLCIFFVLEWRCLYSLGRRTQTAHNAYVDHGFTLSQSTNLDRPVRPMFDRLLGLAAHALAEGESKMEPNDLWEEPIKEASKWTPCADQRPLTYSPPPESKDRSGYILVSADGGLNQQRVAVCNAVAVARMLNATLVLPKFLFSSIWRDDSQFGDIYQENYFVNYLRDDVNIVSELPLELQSLDLAAMGSLLTNAEVPKESKPHFYLKEILPILIRNRVVHFYGFENSLSFDPIPADIQRLRCRCNFHALKFSPLIQETARIMIGRMRDKTRRWGPIEDFNSGIQVSDAEKQLVGSSGITLKNSIGDQDTSNEHKAKTKEDQNASRYLGLHLRFEIDMAAYSLCDFGGGEGEKQELRAFRELHFPKLHKHQESGKTKSAALLREEGQCPLTPEESVLMLAALGFKRSTRIFLAGAHIYGGQARMAIISNLYPNIVTKENLLTPEEMAPFANHTSKLAALDFIGCTVADAFAMTDSGSQLSSLVSGYRIYYGKGYLPSLRPNKKRLASIFTRNMTIEWEDFEERIRKTVKESKRVLTRPVARSVYRHPRCTECMCH